MATILPPIGAIPPVCACGCGQPTHWLKGRGWGTWCPGHHRKGRVSAETRQRMSEARIAHYAGIRRRDLDPTGPGVYSTQEYKQARAQLADGKPCSKCGSLENVHAHHEIPGNDSTIIPFCRKCHASHHHATSYTKRNQPPIGVVPPMCGCGCGRTVGWKRVRGWATYCKGHGVAKVSGKIRCQEAPLCQCGCGESVKFRDGKGWNPYKRGHRQRITGGYRTKPKTPAL